MLYDIVSGKSFFAHKIIYSAFKSAMLNHFCDDLWVE